MQRTAECSHLPNVHAVPGGDVFALLFGRWRSESTRI
jgi:hypothetical protein